MDPRRTLKQASSRGLPLLAALAVLFGAPVVAQELQTLHHQGPGMAVVACGDVSSPVVGLAWKETPREDSQAALGLPEATLLLTNRSAEELLVEVEVTLDAGGQTTQRRLPLVRLEGGATEALAVALEGLQEREAGTSFVAAHAWITDRNGPGGGLDGGRDRGQSASPVLYLRSESGGALTALGEAALRQQAIAEVLTAAAVTGTAGIPPGVTLEMAFEAGQGELRGALAGPNDEQLQAIERALASAQTTDSDDQEIDR